MEIYGGDALRQVLGLWARSY